VNTLADIEERLLSEEAPDDLVTAAAHSKTIARFGAFLFAPR
jgi:hypothetical protein